MEKVFKKQIKQVVLVLLCVCAFPFLYRAQNDSIPNFFGINPSVTVEPFYEKGEMDINIFPFVFQRPMTTQIDFRITTIVNFGIRNSESQFSHFGFETALPIFFKLKDNISAYSKGMYVAPIISASRNRLERHNNVGFWLEPGYNLLFDNDFAMTFGLQLGGTYFSHDQGSNEWGAHFGIKIIFGKWL